MDLIREDKIVCSHSDSLFDALIRYFSFINSKDRAEYFVNSNFVFVNGVAVNENIFIFSKDIILLKSPQKNEPIVDFSYEIIFEDDYLLVINKSGNLPVHSAGRYYFNTLQSQLERDGFSKLDPVNRIDKETSGIVIFAKSKEVLAKLHSDFANRLVKKYYLAFVYGVLESSQGEIINPLKKVVRGNLRDLMICDDSGKYAKTSYSLIESSNNFSLLNISLDHGRRHQIRAHLSSISHPVVGDKLYGSHPDLFIRSYNSEENIDFEVLEKLISIRQLLHARQIEFIHPITKENLSLIADLPLDFVSFLKNNSFKAIF